MENFSGSLDKINSMIKFGFTNTTKEKFQKLFFGKYLKQTEKILSSLISGKMLGRSGTLDLVLIDDKEMRQMNKQYRKKDSPTDVISFAYLEVTEYERQKGDIIVGDIFISVDTAKRQAKENSHDFKTEMAILFVHGLLHVLGFDHNTNKEEAEMEKWAKKILAI